MTEITAKALKKVLKMAKKLPPLRFYTLVGAFGLSLLLFAIGAALRGYAAVLQALH